MADWRLAVEKVLKPEKPQKLRSNPVSPETDHRQVIDTKGKFSAGRFMRVYPVSTRINLPVETRIDTGVLKGAEVYPVFPVSPGAYGNIKAFSKNTTYNSISICFPPSIGDISHSHFSTHRGKPEKPDKPSRGSAGDDPTAWAVWARSCLPLWLAPDQLGAELSHCVWSEAADLRTRFDERAAIAECDGGLARDAAERLARQEVTSGPASDDVTSWRSWMRSRYTVWRTRGYLRAEALGIVWGEAEGEWHKRHRAPPDPDRCAGCGERLPAGTGQRLLDSAIVHIGDPDQVECLAIHGAQWRSAASVGLTALGLMRPRP
jgi:hypothetical protein